MQKKIIVTLYFLCCVHVLQAQDYKELIKQAALQEQQMKEPEALNTYKQALIVKPNDIPALLKCSQLYLIIGYKEKEEKIIYQQYNEAKTYTDKALQADSNNAEINYNMAVVCSRLAKVETEKKKIATYIKNTKVYAEKAIQLKPNFAKAWNILGCWHYDIINLPGFKKTAIKLLYGGLSGATLEQSIQCYEKCLALDPFYLPNYIDLAKAYRDDNQLNKETIMLQKAVKLPVHNSLEIALKIEAKKKLDELQ